MYKLIHKIRNKFRKKMDFLDMIHNIKFLKGYFKDILEYDEVAGREEASSIIEDVKKLDKKKKLTVAEKETITNLKEAAVKIREKMEKKKAISNQIKQLEDTAVQIKYQINKMQ